MRVGVFPINAAPSSNPTTKKQSQGGKREWKGWYKFNDSRVIDWCDCHYGSCTPFLQHVNTDIAQSTFLTGRGKCNRKLEKKNLYEAERCTVLSSSFLPSLLIWTPTTTISTTDTTASSGAPSSICVVWVSFSGHCAQPQSISLCISLVNISLACFPCYCMANLLKVHQKKKGKKMCVDVSVHFHQVVVTDKSC